MYLYEQILDDNLIEDKIRLNIANDCAQLSYILILDEHFEYALRSALIAQEADPSYLLTYTNLALSYLFNDQFEEAKEVYLEWKDKPYDEEFETFKDVFLEDLKVLEKAEITHPDFEKIRRLLEQ
ncbi:hypothetical protein ES705_25970 [subsurface metagenome]